MESTKPASAPVRERAMFSNKEEERIEDESMALFMAIAMEDVNFFVSFFRSESFQRPREFHQGFSKVTFIF